MSHLIISKFLWNQAKPPLCNWSRPDKATLPIGKRHVLFCPSRWNTDENGGLGDGTGAACSSTRTTLPRRTFSYTAHLSPRGKWVGTRIRSSGPGVMSDNVTGLYYRTKRYPFVACPECSGYSGVICWSMLFWRQVEINKSQRSGTSWEQKSNRERERWAGGAMPGKAGAESSLTQDMTSPPFGEGGGYR